MTTAELELEPATQAEPARTDVAVAAAASLLDLEKIDLTAAALAQFGDWRGAVAEATKKFTGLVLDLSTTTKLNDAISLRHRTVNQPIADARKVAKALKSKLATVSKAVGAEEETAVAAWNAVGELLTPQITARQNTLAEEQAERERIAAELKAHHDAEIAKIHGYVAQAHGLPSDRLAKGIEVVQALAFPEAGDFLPQYEQAKAQTLDALRKLHHDAVNAEAAEALRLENERIAAELAAQRSALEAQAAELLRMRVAATHAIVFAFPEPEPEPEQAPAVVAIEIPEAQPPQQVLKAEPAPVQADATARGVAVNVSPRGSAMGAGQAAAAAPAGETTSEEPDVSPLELINTSDLCNLVGLDLSTHQIIEFGLSSHPTPAGRRGTFWNAADANRLTDAIVQHLLEKKAQRNA